MTGYEAINDGGKRILMPGYEAINDGIRGY